RRAGPRREAGTIPQPLARGRVQPSASPFMSPARTVVSPSWPVVLSLAAGPARPPPTTAAPAPPTAGAGPPAPPPPPPASPRARRDGREGPRGGADGGVCPPAGDGPVHPRGARPEEHRRLTRPGRCRRQCVQGIGFLRRASGA